MNAKLLILACSLAGFAGAAAAQNSAAPCPHNNNGDGHRVCEIRSYTMAAPAELHVNPGGNGGISVYGEQRGDVSVKAEVSAWGSSDEEARNTLAAVKVVADGDTLRAEGPQRHDPHWAVNFRVAAPAGTGMDLHADNGGVSVEGMTGETKFVTSNGGITVNNCAGDVNGETTNGGVHAVLSGGQWQGAGLKLKTVNGGVHVEMPSDYRAHLEASTVNGGVHVDFPVTQRASRNEINTDINGGGPTIHVETVNGGLSIGSR